MNGVYNRRVARRLERAARVLAWMGELSFIAVIVIVAIKSCMVLLHVGVQTPHPDPSSDWVRGLGFVAVLLPTIAAASVGIRAYAELTLLARRSLYMTRVMRRWRMQVSLIKPGEPLASRELGEATHIVVSEMLRETDGWAQTFRVKVAEAG